MGATTNYLRPGFMAAFGFNPESMSATNTPLMRGWGFTADVNQQGLFGAQFTPTPEMMATRGAGRFTRAGMRAAAPGNILGLGANAFFVYQGYKDNGFSGAYDALVLNAAIESSIYKWGYGVGNAIQTPGNRFISAGTKVAGSPLRLSTSSAIFRGLGAGVGGFV